MMKTLACWAVAALTYFSSLLTMSPPLELHEALEKGYVTLEVVGAGGYNGDCLKVKLENLHRRSLAVVVPAGQIFEPGDSSLQNIMVAKEETILVEKGQHRIAKLFGFCVEAGDGSPGKETPFRVGKMATGNLLAFARYLSNEQRYKNEYAQSAVWAVSDDERLEGIGDAALANYLADMLDKPRPQYNVQYRQPDQSRILPGTPVRHLQEAFSMNGLFYYTLDRDRMVNFEIYDETGERVHAFYENRRQKRGYHKFRFEFEISGLDPGKYFARLTSGGETIEELGVEF
ncbi:MAG: hypothetical protein AAFZ15_12935 [Bacteroidota bacterium]